MKHLKPIKIFESLEEIESKFDNAIRTGRSETINTDLNGWSEFILVMGHLITITPDK